MMILLSFMVFLMCLKPLSMELLMIIFSFIFIKSLSFTQSIFSLYNNYTSYGGVDKMNSLLLIMLTYIMVMMFLSSNFFNKNKMLNFYEMLKIMFFVLILLFYCSSFVSFYVYFELSILPIFLIITGWGYQTERVSAGLALMFYTITASMPLLIFLLNLTLFMKMYWFSQLFYKLNFNSMGSFFMMSSIFAFLVKLPIFLGHMWLPKAHVEAPVVGSMVLAAVLLKLGGYGLTRVIPAISPSSYLNFILSISLSGSAVIGFICINQLDMKVIIAYSSVAHMGLVIGGLLYLNMMGLSGAMMLMVAHGISSSVMFFGGNIMYTRSFSRSLLLTKGMLSCFPMISFFWLFSMMSSMAAPPMMNLISEILCIASILSFSIYNMLWMALSVMLAGVYSMILYASTQQSGFFSNHMVCKSMNMSEVLVFCGHIFWGLLMILVLDYFMFI